VEKLDLNGTYALSLTLTSDLTSSFVQPSPECLTPNCCMHLFPLRVSSISTRILQILKRDNKW